KIGRRNGEAISPESPSTFDADKKRAYFPVDCPGKIGRRNREAIFPESPSTFDADPRIFDPGSFFCLLSLYAYTNRYSAKMRKYACDNDRSGREFDRSKNNACVKISGV
ncbi:MAG: hypothetical protein IJ230_04875, partial [Clostridia bacterium]|nr:hypothetical protein [Clostridia bacterium]